MKIPEGCAKLCYETGDIITESKESDEIYYIEEGFVKVCSVSKAGETILYTILMSGEIFPLSWAFNVGCPQPYNLYYQALTRVKVSKIKNNALGVFLEDSEISKILLEQISVCIARIDNLSQYKTLDRLLSRLYTLSNRFGLKEGDIIRFLTPQSHQDIANSICATRETVSRLLAELENKKIVITKGHHLYGVNPLLLSEALDL